MMYSRFISDAFMDLFGAYFPPQTNRLCKWQRVTKYSLFMSHRKYDVHSLLASKLQTHVYEENVLTYPERVVPFFVLCCVLHPHEAHLWSFFK